MCDGRLFRKLAPETGEARLMMAERLNGGREVECLYDVAWVRGKALDL